MRDTRSHSNNDDKLERARAKNAKRKLAKQREKELEEEKNDVPDELNGLSDR